MEDQNSDRQTESQEVKKIHDKFFWDIYGRPENTVGFLKDFLPENILNQIDLTRINVRKKSYLSEEYKEHYNDLIVEARLKENTSEPVFIYFLLEHKSTVDKHPAFQLLRYMVEQWYELEKLGMLGSKLPPIIPILIYHGKDGWSRGVHFQDSVNLPHEDMRPYIPDFTYFLSEAATEDEDKYTTSVVIKSWLIIVKYLNDPALRDKLFDIVKQLNDFLERKTAEEYIEIFMKYLAQTENQIRRTDAVKAIESTFPEGGADMIVKGWAKEYVEEGMQQGMQQGMLTEAKEMVLEALDTKFSSNIPADVYKIINALNNRFLLKKLLRSTFQAESIDSFRKILNEIPPEQMQEE